MNPLSLKGTGVALVTPFCAQNDNSVDLNALQNIVEHVLDGGVNYVVALGTTAESSALSTTEKKEVVECIVQTVKGRVPVVMGVGGNSLQTLHNDLNNLPVTRVQALMAVTPYYVKPTQAGLVQYYTHLHNQTKLPIVLYNVPSRTGISLSAEAIQELAHTCERIIALKEASTDLAHCLKICAKVPDGFQVICGNDGYAPALIFAGMQGVISVCANAFPAEIVQITHASLNGDRAFIQERQAFLYELDRKCFQENNPAGIKIMLHLQGLCEKTVRLPLVEGTEKLYR